MTNALRAETSPYLLQHAENPVDWHAWNEAALTLARQLHKPILLSVGYSACHWCHVMAHESFEDEATARLMNELFVNVKVDREERPDIDKIYQTAHQLYTGRPGGWPLTVFLTPADHVPIFTGTYFPKEARYGMPAFREVLVTIDRYFRTEREAIGQRGTALIDALNEIDSGGGDDFAPLTRVPLERARERLGQSYDREHGGFGDAPKFPHPTNLELLLGAWHRGARAGKPDDDALAMVVHTLRRMAQGGLYDQLGGGFYRYSVDRAWAIPHFEKMLYDNAALLAVYADAHAATGEALFAQITEQTAGWIMRDMQDAHGGFYSTLDADSEHEEGKFYVWTPDEVDALLAEPQRELVKRVFGLHRPANFEGRFWHLQVAESRDAAATAAGLDAATAQRALEDARRTLLAAREQRVWPGRDEKVLVAWNGLMIGGLARAARRLARPDFAESAARAVDFIRAELWRDGRLHATYKDGRARFAAYLDDYAFLAHGLLELLQCRWRTHDLDFAVELIEVLLAHFADERGGFFFTADDHERLLHRPKPLGDEAVPSGNGIAMQALLTLGHLLGEQRYVDAAQESLRAALHALERYPEGHATFLHGLEEHLAPPELIVVRGTPDELAEWQQAVHGDYAPHRSAFFIPNDAPGLRGLLAERVPRPKPVAYVCAGTQCRAPIDTPAQLRAALTAD
jgi:hypothetical protein